MLLRDEGKVPYCYKDSLGFDSIGVGRLIDKRKGGGLSDDEIELLLDNDIRKAEQQLAFRLPWTAQLDEPRKAVLVAMAFQLGMDGLLGFVRTLGFIKAGKYELAAQAMSQSKWATQTPARAERMAEQMATGEWQ